MAVKRFLFLALVFSIMLTAAPALADDGFYMVAVGGGVGTRITSLPITINSPGFYYVTGNLSCPSGNGIEVTSSNVTIDLMGFNLSGNSSSAGIYLQGVKNIEIRNGTLLNWDIGIINQASGGSKYRIINIRALENRIGIMLSVGAGNLIKGCNVSHSTGSSAWGIYAAGGIVSSNVVDNYGTGINLSKAGNVIGNIVTCNSGQFGIYFSTSQSDPIVVDQNTVNGAGTHYSGGGSNVVWAGSSGATGSLWGNNAGYP